MKRLGSYSVVVVTGYFLVCVMAALAQKPAPSGAAKPTASPNNAAVEMQEGERLFHTHCGRCHNPPEDISPREARAVVRQMKVRANLSDKDARALLKFLAP